MNFLKKNQILLYVIAFMLVTAGYLNYTTKDHDVSDILQTTTKAEELAGTENIGDARLVSSQVNETTEENNVTIGAETTTTENNLNEVLAHGILNSGYFIDYGGYDPYMANTYTITINYQNQMVSFNVVVEKAFSITFDDVTYLPTGG